MYNVFRLSQNAPVQSDSLATRLQVLAPPVRVVAQELAGQIESGLLKTGSRLPTIRQLAERYGLSTRGISQAVEHLELLGLIERVHGSGCYVRTRGAAEGRPSAGSDSVYLFSMMDGPVMVEQLLRPLVRSLQASGLYTVLVDTAADHDAVPSAEELRTIWAQRPPRGVLVKDGRPSILQLIERAAPPGTRLVAAFQGRSRANRKWHKVESDEYAAYRMAAEWLLGHERKRIGLIMPAQRMTPSALFDQSEWQAPVDAVQDALAEGGATSAPTVHSNPASEADPHCLGLGQKNIEQLANWMTGPDAPDGVVAATWRIECLQIAAATAGLRLGEDILLIGVGDDRPALQGRYPCVSMNHQRIADKAAELIVSRNEELDQMVQHFTIPSELVEVPQ